MLKCTLHGNSGNNAACRESPAMSRCRILEMHYILQVHKGVKQVSSNYWDSFGGKDDMGS